MQKIAAIQKKEDDKKPAAPVLPVQQEHGPDTEVTVTEPGMPLFLQRFSSASSPPPLQREIDEVEKKALTFPKLSVSVPDDEYEREADHVADTVMRMPESTEAPIKPKSVDSACLQSRSRKKVHASDDIHNLLKNPGEGRPIPNGPRSQIEPVLGTDLSHVRVHTDSQAQKAARSIHAKAFTHQNHIYLGEGQSPTDVALMAHESTHVMQQFGNNDGAPLQSSQVPDVQKEEHPASSSHGSSPGSSSGHQVSTHLDTAPLDGEMNLESSLRIETDPVGELGLILPPRLVHERRIRMRTPSGIEAELTIRATTEFPVGFDVTTSPNETLHIPGRVSIGYVLQGTLADGTPVSGMGILDSDNNSLNELANTGPEAIHFGLSPEQQYTAILDAMRQSVSEEVWREAESSAGERQAVDYPSQEEFEQMTHEEKKELAWEKWWEEFSIGNVLKNVLLGLAVVVLAILAVIAAVKGMILLAVLALIAALGLIIWGLWELVETMIDAASQRWSEGDYLGAVLEVLKYAALIAGIILATIVIVASVIVGAPVLAVLGYIALALFVVAAIIAIIQVFREINLAAESERVEDFQQHVQRAAREAEEAVSNLIILIVAWVMGHYVRGRLNAGSEEGRRGRIETVPEERVELERPGRMEGEVVIRPTEGGTVEFVGERSIRLTSDLTGETTTGEIQVRTRVPEGEVIRVRTENTGEGDVFVSRNPDGVYRWRLLSPFEEATLVRYGEVQRRLGLSDEVIEILREEGVLPETIEELSAKGIPGEDMALYALEYGVRGVEVINSLIDQGRPVHIANEITRLAHENGLLGDVHQLVVGRHLENPAGLRRLLREISAGDTGKIQELRDAAGRASRGHQVKLGGEADVVDLTNQEAIQHKEVTSPDERAVEPHLQSAADQLAGRGGEVPPEGFTRIIDIRVLNNRNPLFTADRAAVRLYIETSLRHRASAGSVDVIYFTNDNGTYIFHAPF